MASLAECKGAGNTDIGREGGFSVNDLGGENRVRQREREKYRRDRIELKIRSKVERKGNEARGVLPRV